MHIAYAIDFQQHAAIADAASKLLNEVFEGSRHSRLAFGNSSLPGGMPVELEVIFLLHPQERSGTHEEERCNTTILKT